MSIMLLCLLASQLAERHAGGKNSSAARSNFRAVQRTQPAVDTFSNLVRTLGHLNVYQALVLPSAIQVVESPGAKLEKVSTCSFPFSQIMHCCCVLLLLYDAAVVCCCCMLLLLLFVTACVVGHGSGADEQHCCCSPQAGAVQSCSRND